MSKIEVRDAREPGHFWADNEILDQFGPRIGVYGFGVYMVLARYARDGSCYPSLTTICEALDISRPTVVKALKALKDAGLIRIERRQVGEEGHEVYQSTMYYLLKIEKDPRYQGGSKGGLLPLVNDVYQGSKGDLPGVVNDVYLKKKDLRKHIEENGGGTRVNGNAAAASTDNRETSPQPDTAAVIGKLSAMGATPKQRTRILEANHDLTVPALEAWESDIAARGISPGVMWNALQQGETWPHGIKPKQSKPKEEMVYIEVVPGGKVTPVPKRLYLEDPGKYQGVVIHGL